MQSAEASRSAALSSLPNATIHSLPTELLCEIFSHLPVENYEYPVWSCALVCRLWREPAQRALFAHVDLSSDDSQRAWLDSPARGRYPTRHLKFGARTWVTLGLEILEACGGFQALVVRSRREGAMGGYTYFQTKEAKGVHTAVIRMPHFFPAAAEPISCRLRKLTIHLEEGLTGRVFSSILTNSRDTLQSLTVHCAPVPEYEDFNPYAGISLVDLFDDLVDFFSDTPFPNLKTLEIIDSDPHHWRTILPLLSQVEHLHMHGSTGSRVLKCLAAVGPSTGLDIKVLTVGRHNSTIDSYDKIRIREIVRLPLMGGLQQLVLPWIAKTELEGPTGLALLEECGKRSIAFKCRYGYLTREMMEE